MANHAAWVPLLLLRMRELDLETQRCRTRQPNYEARRAARALPSKALGVAEQNFLRGVMFSYCTGGEPVLEVGLLCSVALRVDDGARTRAPSRRS